MPNSLPGNEGRRCTGMQPADGGPEGPVVNTGDSTPPTASRQSQNTLPPALLCAKKAAAMLGVSRQTILRMNDTGRLPAPVRIGRLVRWGHAELSVWVEHGCPPRKRWGPMWQTLRGKGGRNHG